MYSFINCVYQFHDEWNQVASKVQLKIHNTWMLLWKEKSRTVLHFNELLQKHSSAEWHCIRS